ncbi:uncharacterized protein PSFLO_00274 [Pseudozyma flocculosa]|uniref:Uncharacterized protein n=1 Tax=Pseudozyma flocculosa TaxID=84751 RepID=A0A5C3ER57_9BASI|nr:uncharacterized protein PSFLO_00274 [Pseudozyma flocculosa]
MQKTPNAAEWLSESRTTDERAGGASVDSHARGPATPALPASFRPGLPACLPVEACVRGTGLPACRLSVVPDSRIRRLTPEKSKQGRIFQFELCSETTRQKLRYVERQARPGRQATVDWTPVRPFFGTTPHEPACLLPSSHPIPNLRFAPAVSVTSTTPDRGSSAFLLPTTGNAAAAAATTTITITITDVRRRPLAPPAPFLLQPRAASLPAKRCTGSSRITPLSESRKRSNQPPRAVLGPRLFPSGLLNIYDDIAEPQRPLTSRSLYRHPGRRRLDTIAFKDSIQNRTPCPSAHSAHPPTAKPAIRSHLSSLINLDGGAPTLPRRSS